MSRPHIVGQRWSKPLRMAPIACALGPFGPELRSVRIGSSRVTVFLRWRLSEKGRAHRSSTTIHLMIFNDTLRVWETIRSLQWYCMIVLRAVQCWDVLPLRSATWGCKCFCLDLEISWVMPPCPHISVLPFLKFTKSLVARHCAAQGPGSRKMDLPELKGNEVPLSKRLSCRIMLCWLSKICGDNGGKGGNWRVQW